MYEICRDAARHRFAALLLHSQMTHRINARMPLSFHAVSFGPEKRSDVLRRMVEIAQEVERSAPQTSLLKSVPSSFSKALSTVRGGCLQLTELDIHFIRSI